MILVNPYVLSFDMSAFYIANRSKSPEQKSQHLLSLMIINCNTKMTQSPSADSH